MAFRSLTVAIASLALAADLRADDWPQWMGPTRDGVWAETGLVEQLPRTLKRKWSVPVKYGYAGPAVSAGRVYVSDFDGDGDFTPDPGKSNKIRGTERLFCLDSATGQEKWKWEHDVEYNLSYPAGPRATPTVVRDRVYFLGAMGNFVCLSAKRGEVEWEVDLRQA